MNLSMRDWRKEVILMPLARVLFVVGVALVCLGAYLLATSAEGWGLICNFVGFGTMAVAILIGYAHGARIMPPSGGDSS